MKRYDLVISGAGPVGLLSGLLAQKCGMSVLILDKSEGPLKVGRADALNARTLQLLELAGVFDEIYPHGLSCQTSAIFKNGEFVSRQSEWWTELEGCFHKHFLMLGQAKLESILDQKVEVKRETELKDIKTAEDGVICTLSSGEKIKADYLIGADGSRSFVRNHFNIPFNLVRPKITWAVLDAKFKTNFPLNPEIIVFQNETSDVARIPREGDIERFYVRMDKSGFTQEEVMDKIRKAIQPFEIEMERLEWFSQFSVKESVAETFRIHERVFLAGDACHVHSVNGGQGLNTGLADAVNLIWKLNLKKKYQIDILDSYHSERQPVARSVIESSGELVRSTKYSKNGTHAKDYMEIVKKRAGNITGMGIKYGDKTRLWDFKLNDQRVYSQLDYTKYTLLVSNNDSDMEVPPFVKIIEMTENSPYFGKSVLVRPDSYIEKIWDQNEELKLNMVF